MNLACPTCGAEVSFRFDDSLVRVCPHCKAAVARTDRGAETLGQFADTARVESSLRLFSDGMWGQQSFILVGNAQLRHGGGGVWQEWYAKLGAGVWGWLTEAQGRLFMTFERSEIPAPSYDKMFPNASATIDGKHFTVIERGTATYVSAMGEIPFQLVPQSTFHFVDLADGKGGFATIDYGDGTDKPVVYVGQQVELAALKITGGEVAPQSAPAQGGALKCPDCGGRLELRTKTALSMGCPYCGGLLDIVGGQLGIIGQQDKRTIALDLELGSEGTFVEGKMTVVGYVRRSAIIDGTAFGFEEYLLHSPAVGYRWLVNSDHHWSYVQPIAAGAVSDESDPKYDGVKFTPYQSATLRVDYVIGEFYWRVELGQTVDSYDYIAPPAMLSRENNDNEVTWSLATYLTASEVKKAFGIKLLLSSPIGVAPNQPYPGGVGKMIGLFTLALMVAGIVNCSTSTNAVMHKETVSIPAGSGSGTAQTPAKNFGLPGDPLARPPLAPSTPTPAPTPAPGETGHVVFSKSFKLDDHNIEISTDVDLTNNWAYLAIDLVNEQTGQLVSFDQNLEFYRGVEGGEAWTEGSTSGEQVLGPLGGGQYLMRIDAQQGGPMATRATIVVRQNVFRFRWWLLAFGVLALPYGFVLLHANGFHKRRMENSNVGAYKS